MKRLKSLIETKINEDMTKVEVLQQLKDSFEKKVNAPYIHCEISTLGGKERAALMIQLSLDPKKDWSNGILHNSKYSMFRIEYSMKKEIFRIEQFSYQRGKYTKKFRKAWAKSPEDVIKKINKYLDQNKG